MQAEAEVDAHICARWVISHRRTAHNVSAALLPTVHPTVPILTSLLSVVPARANFCRFATMQSQFESHWARASSKVCAPQAKYVCVLHTSVA